MLVMRRLVVQESIQAELWRREMGSQHRHIDTEWENGSCPRWFNVEGGMLLCVRGFLHHNHKFSPFHLSFFIRKMQV